MKPLVFLLLLVCLAGPALPAEKAEKLEWRDNYSLALEEAKKSGKPIFLDCFADWCTWCHKLDEEVYSTLKFIQLMKDFIPVRIDVEDNAEGTRLAGDFEILGLPTLLVIDPNGKVVNRIGGFLETDALIEDIKKIQRMMEKEKREPPDVAAIYELGREYLARDMHEEAAERFRRILTLSPPPQQRASALFSLALAQYYERKLEEALATLEEFRRNFHDGEHAEDALLLTSEIHLEMESNELAKAYLKEFLQKYPESGNVRRAQEVLELLEVKQ